MAAQFDPAVGYLLHAWKDRWSILFDAPAVEKGSIVI